jgi:hypothetical protein
VYRPLQFRKRSQLFVGAHNETLSVSMCINNPDRSPVGIHDVSLIPFSSIPDYSHV